MTDIDERWFGKTYHNCSLGGGGTCTFDESFEKCPACGFVPINNSFDTLRLTRVLYNVE